MKNISILGSTGSIGRQTMELISSFPEKFRVTGISCGSNIELLAEQVKKFRPEVVSIGDENNKDRLAGLLEKPWPEIYSGREGLVKVAEYEKTDIVVTAVVGYMGLVPTIKAIEKGKDIALANKETLVAGGAIIKKLLKGKKVNILPVDSEHSAIFQCLSGYSNKDISRIILTASGGPFRETKKSDFKYITPEKALRHPTWNMGAKITIDSATLMNKGLEVIEARWLFDVLPDKIDVLIHPGSIIHSLVEFKDRSVLAQMGFPDMKVPILYALTYPERWTAPWVKPLDLIKIKKLEFFEPEIDKFPCLSLAYSALEAGGTMGAVLNAANESAVYAFLNRRISFDKIPEIISCVMDKHELKKGESLEEVLEAADWAFARANELVKSEEMLRTLR